MRHHQHIRGAAGGIPSTLVPLGRPIPNTRIYLLDSRGEPVPHGEPGEVYVGGPGVSAGYLKLDELTRRVFVPDPFAGKPGAVMYRTGDLARYSSGGDLEYLSRRDEQVKIRGYRVELAEIETQLSRHESVRDCAVVVRSKAEDEKSLIAYIVPRNGSSSSAQDLRAYLQSLHPHMVPSAFVFIDRLPLTPTGKLDRQALPNSVEFPTSPTRSQSPTDPVEAAVLNLPRTRCSGRNRHQRQLLRFGRPFAAGGARDDSDPTCFSDASSNT